MAKLIVTTPEGESVVELQPGQVITVGRDPSNRIPLEGDTQASRRHCRIGPRDGGGEGWEVVDLGSTNKTRVDGQAIQRKALSHGDVVEVGNARMRLEDEQEAARLEQATQEGVCYLEYVDKAHRGEKILLQQPRVTVGRRESNSVVLEDRMVSSHHCEIQRDVNGYTLKDLGSTNGTLVNGDPIQEALLAHGSHVRIGNARFVFKDPSMKDVDVELSQFEEDEGWGMMGEIDLSRRPGSRLGGVLVLLLFAAAAAGGYFLMQRGDGAGGGTGALATGLIDNGLFEEEDVFWGADDSERAVVERSAKAGRDRTGGLQIEARAEEGDGNVLVAYEDPIEISGVQVLDVGGAIKRRGEKAADLVVVWSSLAPRSEDADGRKKKGLVTPITRVDTLVSGTGSWQQAQVRLDPPGWAKVARVGVWLEPGARASLDDVRAFTESRDMKLATLEIPTFKKAVVGRSGGLDLMQNRVVLMSDARPLVRVGDQVFDDFVPSAPPQATDGQIAVEGAFRTGQDDEIQATITWRRHEEGLQVELKASAGDAIGLDVALPIAHLSGALSVLGDFPPQRIPAEPGGEPLPGVARTLAGDAEPSGSRPATLLAFTQPDDAPVAGLQIVAGRDTEVLHVRHWLKGREAGMGVVTDFSRQREEAQRALQAARSLMRKRPAEAFDRFRMIAQAYPFEEDIRDSALRISGELEEQAQKDIRKLDEALQGFQIYASPASLEALHALSTRLGGQFLPEDGGAPKGPIAERVAELVGAAAVSERTWRIERAMPQLDRLERLVSLLEGMESYRPLAAVYARALFTQFGDLGVHSEEIRARLQGAKKRFDKLVEDEAVRDAMPPVPSKP